MRRRDAIKVLALPVAAAGCGVRRERIRVAVVWSGWELTQFRRVLRAFPERDTWDVGVQSVGDDIATLLGNRVAGTAVPDVALVPFPELVEASRHRLVPLRSKTDRDTRWDELLTFDGRVYGTWFKVAHKSMVWYREDLHGPRPGPWTWDAWVRHCERLAAAGRPALAIGAADGWVLTDWFENVLLGLAPGVYRGLAGGAPLWRHEMVRTALERLGRLWQISGLFPDGPERALLTQFEQSVLDVFEHRHAAMVAGADFTWPVITQYSSFPQARIKWYPFPAAAGEAVLVGGDAAVLLRPGSEGGRRLIDWLGRPAAAGIWARRGGFLSIHAGDVGYPAGLNADPLIRQVQKGSGDGGTVTFDLSDRLGGRLAGREGRGTWKIFQDFFEDVAIRRIKVDRAVELAVRALDDAARGSVDTAKREPQ